MDIPWFLICDSSSLQVKKYEINEINRNKEIRIKIAPVIFQVRSSLANFFRLIFSSFSGLRSVAAFFGFSGGLFFDLFFCLVAMKTKIIFYRGQGIRHGPQTSVKMLVLVNTHDSGTTKSH